PGGLVKACKIVNGQRGLAAQEFEALQRVKAIRHPFILSLERLEVCNGQLLIITELADKNLLGLQAEFQGLGMPGIPRQEVLGLLREAAEALDWMSVEHGLQHLDVKPHNLFVVSNHLKVADFGLVQRIPIRGADTAEEQHGGGTPLYAAPEVLRAGPSRHSD